MDSNLETTLDGNIRVENFFFKHIIVILNVSVQHTFPTVLLLNSNSRNYVRLVYFMARQQAPNFQIGPQRTKRLSTPD